MSSRRPASPAGGGRTRRDHATRRREPAGADGPQPSATWRRHRRGGHAARLARQRDGDRGRQAPAAAARRARGGVGRRAAADARRRGAPGARGGRRRAACTRRRSCTTTSSTALCCAAVTRPWRQSPAARRRSRPAICCSRGRSPSSRATKTLAQLRALSDASSALAAGELLQREDAYAADVAVERYLRRCELKTAALFEAACRLGALTAVEGSAELADALGAFARRIGLAFQMLDDVLDVSGPVERTGKSRGTDLLDGTVTLPFILAREREPELAGVDLESLSGVGGAEQAEALCERIAATGALDEAREQALAVVAEAKAALPGILPDGRSVLLGLVADAVVERYPLEVARQDQVGVERAREELDFLGHIRVRHAPADRRAARSIRCRARRRAVPRRSDRRRLRVGTRTPDNAARCASGAGPPRTSQAGRRARRRSGSRRAAARVSRRHRLPVLPGAPKTAPVGWAAAWGGRRWMSGFFSESIVALGRHRRAKPGPLATRTGSASGLRPGGDRFKGPWPAPSARSVTRISSASSTTSKSCAPA